MATKALPLSERPQNFYYPEHLTTRETGDGFFEIRTSDHPDLPWDEQGLWLGLLQGPIDEDKLAAFAQGYFYGFRNGLDQDSALESFIEAGDALVKIPGWKPGGEVRVSCEADQSARITWKKGDQIRTFKAIRVGYGYKFTELTYTH